MSRAIQRRTRMPAGQGSCRGGSFERRRGGSVQGRRQHTRRPPAIERVRKRAVRQFDRQPKLRDAFLAASKLRPEVAPDGRAIIGLATSPDREKLWKALRVYARGLISGAPATCCLLTQLRRSSGYLTARLVPRSTGNLCWQHRNLRGDGTVTTIGAHEQFRLSFRAVATGDALSVMVLDFYRSFPYVAMMMMKPGTDFGSPVRLPF